MAAGDEWPEDYFLEVDEQLVHLVAEGLAGDRAVRGRHVDVTVQNCVVIMEGFVDSPEAKAAAGHRVWSIPGVHDVCNRLIVGKG